LDNPADPQSSLTGVSDAIDMPLAGLTERAENSSFISGYLANARSAVVKFDIGIALQPKRLLISCAPHKK
jgi:hypothetical protein